jgi:hypothetical protein
MREFRLGHLAGAVDALTELGHTLDVDVEAEHGKMAREIDGEREAHITKADHANSYVLEGRQRHLTLVMDGVRSLRWALGPGAATVSDNWA